MEFLDTVSSLVPAISGAGVLLVVIALAALVMVDRKAVEAGEATQSSAERKAWKISWVLILVLIGGAFLRLEGLGDYSLGHTEAYIPRIDLPAGISEPPVRQDFVETVSWHFHEEPHPVGYYTLMWGWTGLFGTSLEALRLPAVLLAIASIFLIYRIGQLSYNRTIGWVAAGFLAFSGFHMYWSQLARMYVPGCFFGLIATWALCEMFYGRRRSRPLEVLYVLSIVLGTQTVVFFWPFLLLHLAWSFLNYRREKTEPGNIETGSIEKRPWARVPRLVYLQTLAVILSTPAALHIVYMSARPVAPPTFGFLINFFSFGFLTQADTLSNPERLIPLGLSLAVLAFALLLLGCGSTVKPEPEAPLLVGAAPPFWPLLLVALGMTLVLIGLSFIGTWRNMPRLAVSVVPLGALAIPFLVVGLAPSVRRLLPFLNSDSALPRWLLSPAGFMSVLPTVILFAVSFHISVIAPRAFIIFVPYLLLTLAAGTVALARGRASGIALAVILATVFGASIWHFKSTPKSAKDYGGIAAAVNARLEPEDLIFARPLNWRMTPVFYYFDNNRIVADSFETVVNGRPEARIWVIQFGEPDFTDEMHAALDGKFVRIEELEALYAKAFLYQRKSSEDTSVP